MGGQRLLWRKLEGGCLWDAARVSVGSTSGKPDLGWRSGKAGRLPAWPGMSG